MRINVLYSARTNESAAEEGMLLSPFVWWEIERRSLEHEIQGTAVK